MDSRTHTRPPAVRARAKAQPRPDRRQAILLAAEKLFAQYGYHAVSIRQIATEAQVPLALVAYYFGQKQALFHAIFAHWSNTIDERLVLLAQAREGKRGRRMLERVVLAFIAPVIRLRDSAEGEYYAQLVARELAYRTPEADRVLSDYFDPMAHAFIDALHDVCPGSTRADAAWAYQFALGALIHNISDTRVQRLSRGESLQRDPQTLSRLAKFISAGVWALLAPAPIRSRSTDPTTPRRLA